MIPFSLILLLLYSSVSASPVGVFNAEQTIEPVIKYEVDGSELGVENIRLTEANGDVILFWDPLPAYHTATRHPIREYHIYCGADPECLDLIGTTTIPRFIHKRAMNRNASFYKVIGVYSIDVYGQIEIRGETPQPRRDDTVILDFDEGDLDLQPYSEEEDVNVDAWELTDEETLPESARSLKLSGNTWKRLDIEVVAITDSTVWSIGILSVDGDTMADLQAFGVGDDDNELFYTFHGLRGVWAEPWVVSYQDIYGRGDWHIYRLALGYDWNIRYEYLPELTELYFINDNDNNDTTSASIYFDDVIDITASITPAPVVTLNWRYDPGHYCQQVEGMGLAVGFSVEFLNCEPDEMIYRWDFGDGMNSVLPNPTHLYGWDGVYTASVTVIDSLGSTGRASADVTVGDMRYYQGLTALFTGDVMLARRYEDPGGIIDRLGPEAVFERIRERFSAVDLRLVNLESTLTDEGSPHPTKDYIFRGNPRNVAGLTYAGIDMVSLGNNHMHDYGRRGLEETLEVLDGAGIGPIA